MIQRTHISNNNIVYKDLNLMWPFIMMSSPCYCWHIWSRTVRRGWLPVPESIFMTSGLWKATIVSVSCPFWWCSCPFSHSIRFLNLSSKNGTVVWGCTDEDGPMDNLHICKNIHTEWHTKVLKTHVMPSSQHLSSRKAMLISANSLMCALKQHCYVEKKFGW